MGFQYRREQEKLNSEKSKIDAAMAAWKLAHPMPRGTIHDVIDHIEHVIEVAGIDHVGLGSDYDGVSVLPTQLDDVSSYPYITQALVDRGYREEDIVKVLGGNLLRVMHQAEQVAQQIANSP